MRVLFNNNLVIGVLRSSRFTLPAFLLVVVAWLASFYAVAQPNPLQNSQYQSLPKSATLNLTDKNIFYFELREGEIATFYADQTNSDIVYIFSRHDRDTLSPIKITNVSDSSYLTDITSITFDECQRCIIEIIPFAELDQQGQSFLQTAILTPEPNTAGAFQELSLANQKMWLALNNITLADTLYESILIHYTEAASYARIAGNTELETYCLFLYSNAAHYLHNFSAQKNALEQLIVHSDLSNEMFVRIRIYLAELYHEDLVTLSRTRELINEAYTIASSLKSTHLYAKVLQTQAALYESIDDFLQANELWERALEIQYDNTDIRRVVKNLINLGWAEYNHNNNTKAISYYNRALSYLPPGLPTQQRVNLDIKLAKAYRSLGDFERATRFIDSALVNNKNYPNSLVHGWAFQEKARILMVTGQPSYAVFFLEKAMLAYQAISAHSEMNDIDYFLGDVLISLQLFSDAKQYVKRVLEFDMQHDSPRDIASGLHKLARIEWAEGDYEAAIRVQKEAIVYIESISDKTLKPLVYGQAAALLAEVNQIPEAFKYYEQALQALGTDVLDYRKINLQYDLARALTRSDNRELALEILAVLPQQAADHARQITRPDLKRRYVATLQEIVELYNHLHGDEENSISALLLSEELRATTLVFSKQIKANQPSDGLFASQRAALFSELLNAASISSSRDNIERAKAQKKIQALTEQIYVLESHYYSNQQRKRAGQSASNDSFELTSLRKHLSQDEVILYFDTGELSSSIWFISSKEIKHHRFDSNNVIENLAKTIFQRVTLKHPDVASDFSLLSEMIFSASSFSFANVSHIKVIPDGALSLIPFSLLTFPNLSGSDVAVSYAASLRTLNLNQSQFGSDAKILAIGNPKMVSSYENKLIPSTLFSLEELPYSQLEIDTLQSFQLPNTVLLTREKASKTQFQQELSSEFDLIHIATHGIANTQFGEASGIVFSNSLDDQNFLIAAEISAMSIPTQLVVLSGCETTLGELIPGEGLMGLSRAFFEAGAGTVIGSLWKVQDSATAVLFDRFYKYLLLDNLSASESLSLAKQYVRYYRRSNGVRPWQHPFYWSGFVMYSGKGDHNG